MILGLGMICGPFLTIAIIYRIIYSKNSQHMDQPSVVVVSTLSASMLYELPP